MQVEQISYGSANGRRMKGYQVTGTSPGVDSAMSAAFCQWAPSHDSLDAGHYESLTDAWALSFFQLSDEHFAVARTVHGGPEYSGRGGLSVVTNALIMTRNQLFAYQYHGVDIARTALALGHLLLRVQQDAKLPAVTMTRTAISMREPETDWTDSCKPALPEHAVHWIARETVSLTRDGRKVLIVGRCDPLPILNLALDHLSVKERSEISFACGLKPSHRRDFRIQFSQDSLAPKTKQEMERSGFETIDVDQVLVETS